MTNEQLKRALSIKGRIEDIDTILTDVDENNSVLRVSSLLSKPIQFDSHPIADDVDICNIVEKVHVSLVEILKVYKEDLEKLYDNI